MPLSLGPDFEWVVPTSCSNGSAVRRDFQARDTILMSVKHGHTVALQCVPDVDGIVVVACKQDSPGRREVDGVDSEEDGLLGVLGNLAVCSLENDSGQGMTNGSVIRVTKYSLLKKQTKVTVRQKEPGNQGFKICLAWANHNLGSGEWVSNFKCNPLDLNEPPFISVQRKISRFEALALI